MRPQALIQGVKFRRGYETSADTSVSLTLTCTGMASCFLAVLRMLHLVREERICFCVYIASGSVYSNSIGL